MQAQRSVPPPSEQHPVSREFRHTARNLLTVILVNTEFILESIVEDEESRAALADILEACGRLTRMVETASSPAFESQPIVRLVHSK